MKTTVVRYQAKPERADENQQRIEAVFAALATDQPAGFTYEVLRLEDGVSFIHMVTELDVEKPDSLAGVAAFQDFVAGVTERCDVAPVAMVATVVGAYGVHRDAVAEVRRFA